MQEDHGRGSEFMLVGGVRGGSAVEWMWVTMGVGTLSATLPRRSEGCRLQEKRGHQQVCRVLCDVLAEELSPQPALGQATHFPETLVLLLEPRNGMKCMR
ncbi:hypothetical protein EYF80_022783 [Liparis tanakae]|uniref:Uncharacterized protein n=1 Tax=Liparis tanakae TaxID=230148 RepID=A0A4Z2HN47_9TELE|nr:hypothetical protein EYF80_022783 [Liparis tanakae]